MNDHVKNLCLSAALALFSFSSLAGEATVDVGHGTFDPASVTIMTGETVVFDSTQKMPGGHTVVIDELEVQSPALDQGETWSYTFEKPGNYHARVKEHPKNAAEVIVKP